MSNRAITWALKQNLATTPKFVLVVLADFADEQDSCFPGQQRIAQMVGADSRTVRRALKLLKDEGYLHTEERRREDGYRSSDRYFLHCE